MSVSAAAAAALAGITPRLGHGKGVVPGSEADLSPNLWEGSLGKKSNSG